MGDVVATTELDSPIGRLRLAATAGGLVRIALPGGSGSGFHGWLQRALPDAERIEPKGSAAAPVLPVLEQGRRELGEYFEGVRREFGLELDLRGTPFQRSVWLALAEIPYGETCSYAEIARAVKRPRAFRAVGAANGANPLPLVLPCHRVIAADGTLGGYGGGLETKRHLLAFEQSIAHRNRLL